MTYSYIMLSSNRFIQYYSSSYNSKYTLPNSNLLLSLHSIFEKDMKAEGKPKVICFRASIHQVEGYVFQMERSLSVHRHSARHKAENQKERERCVYREHICKSHFSICYGEEKGNKDKCPVTF